MERKLNDKEDQTKIEIKNGQIENREYNQNLIEMGKKLEENSTDTMQRVMAKSGEHDRSNTEKQTVSQFPHSSCEKVYIYWICEKSTHDVVSCILKQ